MANITLYEKCVDFYTDYNVLRNYINDCRRNDNKSSYDFEDEYDKKIIKYFN